MVRYVHPDVEDALKEASGGDPTTLALVMDDEAGEDAISRISNLDHVSHKTTLPSGVILVNAISTTSLAELKDVEGVESISPDQLMRDLA